MVLYAYMCVFVYSRFVENPPDMILGDKPLISEVVLSQRPQPHLPCQNNNGLPTYNP
jgi:hypothetical protein